MGNTVLLLVCLLSSFHKHCCFQALELARNQKIEIEVQNKNITSSINQDQYGEEIKKKLGAKFFKEILYEIHEQFAPFQKQILEERFQMWKGENRQIDDVLVVGVLL